jgi:argininosuccinate lyase
LQKKINKAFAGINSSIAFDKVLYREDIRGSIAYAKALFKANILGEGEMRTIIEGLEAIKKEIDGAVFDFREEDEDIHMNIERRLFERIGETAHKLHTGRSRNEQIALDERLFLMGVVERMQKSLDELLKSILFIAEEQQQTVIPSYTHLRQAQLISLAHLLLAYLHALKRDRERLKDYRKRLTVMPLGSGAVAGSVVEIDREFLLNELGFESLSRNSIDAVSTRDFIIEFVFICASLLTTLSRISEDIIFYSSDEIGYVSLPDDLTTTSSLMPQKKNPDSLELIRGKSARVIAHLASLFILMKGLPYTYNRDLQEDKEGLFDTVDTTIAVLNVMNEVFRGLEVHENRIKDVLDRSGDFLFATDLAHYLVKKGIAFRDAHMNVGRLVRLAAEKKKKLSELSLEEYKKYCPQFDEDVYGVFDWTRSVNSHNVVGGTALNRIEEELEKMKKDMDSGA